VSNAPIILYVLLFLASAFAPFRWSIIAFALLSNIDLGAESGSIGALNTAKAMILPVYMLWRFRAYGGHSKITAAPFAWCVLILYVTIASTWSFYPAFAIKLIGHLIGSFLICMMLMRASKGGFLTLRMIVPISIGVLAMAAFHWRFLHDWGGETERFTTFSGAQAFAAFIAALYCAAISARTIKPAIRIPLAIALALAVVLNGSRIWMIGLACSSIVAIFVSHVRPWAKVITFGAGVCLIALLVLEFDDIMTFASKNAKTNRIAAAISAAYEGNLKATGLGTYNLRHELFRRSLEATTNGTLMEIIFGHGTCNGAAITATLSRNPDPNRAMHNEWLRAAYEWGLIGLGLWSIFIGSLAVFAARGAQIDPRGYAQPLLIYLPAFVLGLSGENIVAGAGNAVSVGLLLLIALASVSHRPFRRMQIVRGSYDVPTQFSGKRDRIGQAAPLFFGSGNGL